MWTEGSAADNSGSVYVTIGLSNKNKYLKYVGYFGKMAQTPQYMRGNKCPISIVVLMK
jgi:hypothetical protein